MRDIARLSEKDKKALFHNTAAKMGMTDAIIEKDFWVCYMLDYLFHRSAWKNNIAFKGGTSLSKSYGLIERFSEDIDLILDWRVLGYEKNEPWADRSNTKQDVFNKEAGTKTEAFLRNEFMPAVIADLQDELSYEDYYNRLKSISDKINNHLIFLNQTGILDEPQFHKLCEEAVKTAKQLSNELTEKLDIEIEKSKEVKA